MCQAYGKEWKNLPKNSGTANEILGISPSELTGLSLDEIKNLIRDVQDGLSASEPRMNEEEIDEAAKKILVDAQEI